MILCNILYIISHPMICLYTLFHQYSPFWDYYLKKIEAIFSLTCVEGGVDKVKRPLSRTDKKCQWHIKKINLSYPLFAFIKQKCLLVYSKFKAYIVRIKGHIRVCMEGAYRQCFRFKNIKKKL